MKKRNLLPALIFICIAAWAIAAWYSMSERKAERDNAPLLHPQLEETQTRKRI